MHRSINKTSIIKCNSKLERREALKNFMEEVGFNLEIEGQVQFMELNGRIGVYREGRVSNPTRW